VRYEHRRGERRFGQLGTEVFWALIDDTSAFDELFA